MINDIESKKRFARAIAGVLCGFYRLPAPDIDTLRLWAHALEHLDLEQIETGLNRHVQDPDTGQFPPKPADVIRHALGKPKQVATIAWGRVLDGMKSAGKYVSVDFGDPAIHCAVRDLGGWVELCSIDVDQLPFVQARFERAYVAYVAQGCGEYPTQLLGITSHQRLLHGYDALMPLQLGNSPCPVALDAPRSAAPVNALVNEFVAATNMVRPANASTKDLEQQK